MKTNSFNLQTFLRSSFTSNKKHNNNDIKDFFNRLNKLQNKYDFIELGKIEEYPINLLSSKKKNNGKNILICAGLHGDETAPCWAMLQFLETYLGNDINVSFIPLINPTGFEKNTRDNKFGDNPNRGYFSGKNPKERISEEGKILVENFDKLKSLAKDGFFTMHEDDTFAECFLYTYRKANKLETDILKVMQEHFDIVDNDKDVAGVKIFKGVATLKKDGDETLETYFIYNGIPVCITTETPGNENLKDRISTNVDIIKTIIDNF